MNLTDKYDVAPGFEDLFSFSSEADANAHEAQMIVFRFLSEIQKAMDIQRISRKELAKRVNTSASYITQIFRGDKQPNFDLLARMERALGITFNIGITQDCAVVSYEAEQPVANVVVAQNRPASRQRPYQPNFDKVSDYQWLNKYRPAYA